ncbi:hypothetical protein DdX_16731 [Ditylenchus destructor]|uniref:Uncharacterized protein n=1 Tax=Ditylenchus destructor TaxID=166010 RepID=A0AAD4MSN9_9BILA|nr:hypothetical protein DdX_16731 [Ditylenchus destructor]
MNTSTRQTILPRPYLHWLVFVQTLITIAFQIIAVALLSRIVFYRFAMKYKYETRNMSTLVIVYMIVHIIGSSMSLPYELYLAVFWKPAMPIIPIDNPLYDPYVLYWTGAFMVTYIMTAAVPVFFLTLDRCVALKFPIYYHNNIKSTRGKILTLAITVIVLWCLVSGIFGTVLELPLDISTVVVDMVREIALRIPGENLEHRTMHWTARTDPYGKRGNRPKKKAGSKMTYKNFASRRFVKIAGESQANVFGNIVMLPFTFDALICSMFYTRTFLRKSLHQSTKTSSLVQILKSRVVPG